MNRELLLSLIRRVDEIVDGTDAAIVLALVNDIQAARTANELSSPSAALPYAVFERLVDTLGERLSGAGAADEHLLSQLERLSVDPHIVAPLIQRLRTTRIAAYNATLGRDPHDRTARLGRAALRIALHDAAGAIDDLADLADTDDEALLALRAAARIDERLYTDALSDLNRLIALQPGNWGARRDRAHLYIAHHYPDLAEPDIAALSSAASSETLAFCARFRIDQGNAVEAVVLAQRAASSGGAMAYDVLLGEALLAAGRSEDAIAAVRAALPRPFNRYDPDTRTGDVERALYVLAQAQHRLGFHEAAAETWLEALALMGAGDDIWRGYILATDRLLHREVREVDHTYLTALAAHPNADPDGALLDDYAKELANRSDPRAELLRARFDSASPSRPAFDADLLDRAKRRWVEANMDAAFRFGLPWSVQIHDIQNSPDIARRPWVYTVRSLTVIAGRCEIDGAMRLLFASELPALQCLAICAELFSFDAVRGLIRAQFFARLRSLRLCGCDLDAPALELIVGHLPAGVRSLSILGGNAVPALGLAPRLGEIFRTSDTLGELDTLDLVGCALDRAEVRKILSSRMPRLRSLNLSGNDLAGLDPAELLSFPLIRQLSELAIGYSGLEKTAVPLILDRIGELALQTLGADSDWTPAELTALRSHRNFSRLHIDLGIDPAVNEAQWLALFDSMSHAGGPRPPHAAPSYS